MIGLLGSVSFQGSGFAAENSRNAPVDFTADEIIYDDANQTVTASGTVEIIQNGKIVKADKVTYSMVTESVRADGNVVMMDTNGDVHFADALDFKDDLRNGYIRKLRSVLADGSRMTAEEGQRRNGEVTELKQASYTPCEPCKADPDKPPVWQIKAGKVTHDQVDHTISYNNATFELGGVPVAYMPYFSHPDGTVAQKSGFLAPTFSLNSQQGFGFEPRYYWAIAPDRDATIATRIYTKDAPLFLGEYRQRFEDAEIKINASTTYSGRTDSIAGEDVNVEDEWRGHFFSEGLWNIDDRWRAGFNTQLSSDDQFLRQYDISSDNVLENEVYTERFDDRDYAVARVVAFQDVRVSERAIDQPNILPEIQADFLGDPNGVLGGRWNLDVSALGLTRKGSGQDVLRGSVEGGWQRRDVLDIGLVNTLSGSLRGDVYSTPKRDENLLGSGGEGDSTAGRFFPSVHNVTTYPLVSQMEGAQVVIEPTVAFTATTDVDNDSDIPNEDSQDVQLDAINIFSANRFPGYDRVEDRTRVTYGARTGVYGEDGSVAELFLGQSHRLNSDDNPFPEGSGLSENKSDLVGQMIASYGAQYGLNYRFQLASENLQSEQHEVEAHAIFGPVDIATNYLYARALAGTDLNETREQVYGAIGWQVSEQWKLRSAVRYDMGINDGLRMADVGFDYLGQCINLSATARKNYTDDDTGENATEILLRVGFKNLGEFATAE